MPRTRFSRTQWTDKAEGKTDQDRLVLYKNPDGHKNQTRLNVRHDGLKSRWIKSITSMDGCCPFLSPFIVNMVSGFLDELA